MRWWRWQGWQRAVLIVAVLLTASGCALDGQPDSFSPVDFFVVAGVVFSVLIAAWIVFFAVPCAFRILIGCPLTLLTLAALLYVAYLIVWFLGVIFNQWPSSPPPWPFYLIN